MTAGAVLIRVFSVADQQAARQLVLEGLGEHFGFIDETLNPDLDDIPGYYLELSHVFVVAEQAGAIIGTGALLVEGTGIGQVVRVSVAPSCRRQGLGRALVAYLLDEARQRGLGRVLVETNRDWYDAIALYLRHGFVEYARDDVSVYLALTLAATDSERTNGNDRR